jgi:hypothetical protein
MIETAPRTAGLSGDLGWGDADDDSSGGGFNTALLVVATTAYWGLTWLSSGLAPLPLLASRLRPRSHLWSTQPE